MSASDRAARVLNRLGPGNGCAMAFNVLIAAAMNFHSSIDRSNGMAISDPINAIHIGRSLVGIPPAERSRSRAPRKIRSPEMRGRARSSV